MQVSARRAFTAKGPADQGWECSWAPGTWDQQGSHCNWAEEEEEKGVREETERGGEGRRCLALELLGGPWRLLCASQKPLKAFEPGETHLI